MQEYKQQSNLQLYYLRISLQEKQTTLTSLVFMCVCENQEFALINNGHRHLLIILLLHSTCSIFTFPSSALFYFHFVFFRVFL
jgi:hypothetical protein